MPFANLGKEPALPSNALLEAGCTPQWIFRWSSRRENFRWPVEIPMPITDEIYRDKSDAPTPN